MSEILKGLWHSYYPIVIPAFAGGLIALIVCLLLDFKYRRTSRKNTKKEQKVGEVNNGSEYSEVPMDKPPLWKGNELYKELYDLLCGYSDLEVESDPGKDNKEAMHHLIEALVICRELYPGQEHNTQFDIDYWDYVQTLMFMRFDLIKERYIHACYSLFTIVYFFPLNESRILRSVTVLLSEFLDKDLEPEFSIGCGKEPEIIRTLDVYGVKNDAELIRQLYSKLDDIPSKLAALDYFMKVVKISIMSDPVPITRYSDLEELYLKDILPARYFGRDDSVCCIETTGGNEVEIDLTKKAAMLIPPEGKRIMDRLVIELQCGGEYLNTDLQAIYSPDLGLTFICDSRNRSLPEICRENGNISAKVIDIKPLFRYVKADTHDWHSALTHREISEVFDFRIGLLYEAARISNELQNSGVSEKNAFCVNKQVTGRSVGGGYF